MQALLSDHWHAVRHVRPRLREGVQTIHRRLRGKPWVLIVDPQTQRFHRLSPAVFAVLERLDGRRTLDDVWDDVRAGGDAAISQHELVQLLGSLYASDLLQSQVAPDAAEAFERHRRQRNAKLRQSFFNPLSIRVPLLHPDAWFEGRAATARRLFSWPALMLWLALVLPGAALAWQHWHALTENLSDRVLSSSNLVLLWFTYPAVKALHECAHGFAVKAFGGQVREIGLMFILFTPVPYVDATSSYRFASKWRRMAVAAAGIMAELAVGAVAVFVWLLAEPGLVTAVAFNVVLIAGVSTLVVNGNPLMRYDGYFILCDWLEMPNLAQRANQFWTWVVDRRLFGSRDAEPPLESSGERRVLAVYGVVSPIYRLVVTAGLILFVASEYLAFGVAMAVVAAWMALVVPLWRGWKHLSEAPALARRRGVARRRAFALGTAAIAFVAFVPLPFHLVHQGVVWLPEEAIVRAAVAGHVERATVVAGAAVAAGEPLAQLASAELLGNVALAEAGVEQVQAQLRKAETNDIVRAQALRSELASRQARLDDAAERARTLGVTAATEGRWVPAAPTALEGRWVRRGEVLGYVVGPPSRLVRAAVTQEDMDLIRSRLHEVQVRLGAPPREPGPAVVRRQVPGGEFELVSAALGTSGGGEIAVDPAQAGGKRSLKRVFDLEIEMGTPSPASVFGDRAWVRFDLGSAPLGWQWYLRLRQLFLSRFSV